jgi:hypothetical protein
MRSASQSRINLRALPRCVHCSLAATEVVNVIKANARTENYMQIMLLEVERVVGVEDDVGLFFDDQHRHRKVSHTGAAPASDCPPARDRNAMLVD